MTKRMFERNIIVSAANYSFWRLLKQDPVVKFKVGTERRKLVFLVHV